MKNDSQLLDPGVISRAETLGLHARFVVEGYMAGEHKSPYRGFAVEFAQHREYSPGDDLRHLDWKVLGKTDRFYLKQYEQETNYVAHILLDGSESMNYGSGKITKLQYGKIMAACLSYLILNQRDAVSLSIFDQGVKSFEPRSDNRAVIHSIMNRLSSFQATSAGKIGENLHDLAVQTKRKGIVIIISDLFEDEEEVLAGIQHLRFCKHEVILLHVMDRYELEFPLNGLIEFVGMEQAPNLVTPAHEIRKSYLEAVGNFQTRIRQGCEKNDCHYHLANTSHPLEEMITSYLNFRHRTMTR